CYNNLRQVGLAMLMYADDHDGQIPRGNIPYWWQVFIPSLSGGKPALDEYGRVKVYTCPSYPDKRQVICYVVNAWRFSNSRDQTGSEITGLQKLSQFKNPAEAIYLAD